MFCLIASKRFQKNLANFINKHPELEIILKEKLNFLQHNPNDSRLKTHKLSGKLKNCWAIWITYEHRLIFHLENKYIFLLAVGTHNEVY